MTLTSSIRPHRPFSECCSLALAGLLAMAPVLAAAQSTPPPAQPSMNTLQPNPGASFQQSMRQQQLRDQLQKNQLEEQLRQNNIDASRRPSASTAEQAAQQDQADRAQRAAYQAQQQAVIDRYRNAPPPPPVIKSARPASSRSGG